MRIELSRLIAFVAILILTGLPRHGLAAEGYAIIANPSSSADSLTTQILSDIFLKKTNTWPDGAAVTPVDQVPRSPVRGKFSIAIHKKPLGAIKAYWNKLIFSGKDTPPAELKTNEEIIAFVKATPGAIGYVGPDADTTGLEVIAVQ